VQNSQDAQRKGFSARFAGRALIVAARGGHYNSNIGMKAWRSAARLTWLLVVCGARASGAQTLPSEPIALAQGRVTIGGDVSASFGSEDPGFFNYTDYAHSALRLLRVDISGAVKAGPHFTLLGEVRSENLEHPEPYALYLRIRPWTARDFDLQVGRVPPTFGGFTRRTYANDNLLIGYPLAYQYLTTLRPDALPASADELLRKRSLGWDVGYSIGDPTRQTGVPLVSAFKFDTGVQAHATTGIVSLTASVTAGTVSNPLFNDDNDGRQIAGRVELRPVAGLIVATSAARGPFVAQSAARAIGEPRTDSLTQTAWGADVEYSRGYYLLRWETIVSAWRLPTTTPPPPLLPIDGPLTAVATSIEGRYKIRPGLYAAARFDHLGFSEITGAAAGTVPWDAPVSRIEAGGGYSIQRNLLLKLSYQYNTRDGGVLLRTASLGAAQLVFWF
jgi:hypothetical protein